MKLKDIIGNIELHAGDQIEVNDFEEFSDVAQDYIEDLFIDDKIGGNVQAILIQALDRSSTIDDFMYVINGDKFAQDFKLQQKFDNKERSN